MSAILLEERIVHYEVLGRGRPVLFLHGWVGSWRYWVPAMQSAAVSFRAYALDLWGFGDSSKETGLYKIEDQVALIQSFLDEMGIGKVALVGHGFGAIIAAIFTQKHPHLVDRLMVVSMPVETESISSRLLKPSSPADLVDWLLGKDTLADLARGEANKVDMEAISESFISISAINLAPILPSLSTPCLVVHGQTDPAIKPPNNDQIVAMPDNIHHIILESSGHFPMLDDSTIFIRLMTDFLALASGDSPRVLQMKDEWKRRVR